MLAALFYELERKMGFPFIKSVNCQTRLLQGSKKAPLCSTTIPGGGRPRSHRYLISRLFIVLRPIVKATASRTTITSRLQTSPEWISPE